ncbi:hypothetical protein [Microbispora sp. KK1-11]|uniref:hypothetical protein n=1 Tax=Microbispora sp. KK1-11 TaxID=2053005 RepID=UPI00115A754E|nr:hypothetical protein [Microbispora sp. KK1-11]TQS22493.1 hypothetical protein FLW16_37900 [Microbispora sp. KK1-11]
MSEQVRSSVSVNHGFLHTGDGDLNVFLQLAAAAGKDPRVVADDHLRWLRRRFLEPGGFGRARTVLESSGTVLLEGAPGTGRKAAAWMLLAELYSGAETFKEILPEEKPPYLRTGHVSEGALLLVDLSVITSEASWTEIQNELPGFRTAVREHGAHLVAVLPDTTADPLGADLRPFRVEITRPRAGPALQRYLRAGGVPAAETGPEPAGLSGFLAVNPPMRRIAYFAELVIEARASARPEDDFAAWCAAALAVLDNKQSVRVTEKLAVLVQGPQRALLLATAMLHGAPAEVVRRGAAQMLQVVEHPQDTLPLLEHEDITVRLKAIDAAADSSGRVRFTSFGYDAAVRAHFWAHWPELRQPIERWMTDTVGLPGMEDSDRETLVKRFADLCLHDRYRDLLLDFVRQCAQDNRNGDRMSAAVQALRRGLEHEAHGRFFRRRIYDWSKDTAISKGLSQVLVVACWKVIAVHHPDQAMVRLHHLARRERGTTHARDALDRIVAADDQLRVWMLKRLADRLESADETWKRFDAGMFLEFVGTVPLTAPGPLTRPPLSDPAVRERLISGWHAVLRLHPYETWRRQAERWIRAALEDERNREHLLDVLVGGGGQRTDLLAPLYIVTRDLALPTSETRERHARLVGLVRQKIDAALGLQMA